jgi:hypothetical protein
MQFFTSYFGNVRRLPKEMVLISISRWDIRWEGWKMKSLSPTVDILAEYKREPNEVRYTKRFRSEVLGQKDCDLMVRNLEAKFGPDAQICFLCYEGPGKFCHRHLVADWMTASGYECREWQ